MRFTCYGEFAPTLPPPDAAAAASAAKGDVAAAAAAAAGAPTAALQRRLVDLVEHALPDVAAMCDLRDAVAWHGARPLTPDSHPLVGPTRVPGLFVNTGHSFNGWREACHSARLLAARVQGVPPAGGAEYAAAFSMRRFQPFGN